jgi:mRNA-degrading endonuclease YafQ of YafQ-DinJ toxin-antitoxin module
MMMQVVWSNGFKRSFKKITKKNAQLTEPIVKALRLRSSGEAGEMVK